MPRTGFYNDNANRNYPFTSDSTLLLGGNVSLPTSVIVDFGCILGQGSQFSPDTHQVTLESITRSGTQYIIQFQCNAPGLATRPLQFVRNITDAEYATEFTESATFSSGDDAACDIDFPAWEGFLVTGDLTELANIIADGTVASATADGFVLELARVQNIENTFVQTVNLANAQRLRVTPPPGCVGVGTASNDGLIPAPGTTVVNASCLAGPLLLQEGYNCFIVQNTTSNTISINAVAGAGAGDPCNDEVPRYDGEIIPANSNLYTGGPSCFDLLRSINGITGPEFKLTAGDGVSILTPANSPHTITVDVNLRSLAVCEPPLTIIGNPDDPSGTGNPGGISSAENVPSTHVVTFCSAVYPDQCIEVTGATATIASAEAVGTPALAITSLGIDDGGIVPDTHSVTVAGAVTVRPASIIPPVPQIGTPTLAITPFGIAPPATQVPEPLVAIEQTITFSGIDAPVNPVPYPDVITLILPASVETPTDPVPRPTVSITGVDSRRSMHYYRRQHNSANLLAQRRLSVVQFGPFINPAASASPLTNLTLTVEISKDGGETFTARTSNIVPVHDSEGWYQVYLEACDTSEVGPLIVRASDSGGTFLPVWREFLVVSDDYHDAKIASGTCS